MNLYRNHSLIACLILSGMPTLVSSVSAANLIWDADGTSGGATGGTGPWNSTGANFWDNAGTMQSWTGGAADTALFGGTAGTATLGTAITAGGLLFSTSGYTIAGGGNTLTLAAGGTIAGNYATSATTTISAALGGTNLTINPLVVNTAIANASQGQFTIATNTAHTGTLTIGGGAVVVNNGISLASGGGVTVNGSGLFHPNSAASYPNWRLRQGILQLNGTGDQIGSQMVTLNGGTVLRVSPAGGSDTGTIQNATAATGFNTFAAGPAGGAPSGDTLAITNLTRNATATVEFRSQYGTLGANGDNGKVAITNLNGSAVANTNGILGGWAYANIVAANNQGSGASEAFATWDSAQSSVRAATPDKASNTSGGTLNNQSLSAASATDNWLANGVNGNNTITANKTINSLIAQNDVIISSGATLTLGSGGFIMRSGNFWMQSADNNGKLTSGEANGKLYLNTAATVDALTDLRVRVQITNNGTTPVQLIKTGTGSTQLGQYNNGASTNNNYSGGTIIQAGRLQAAATNAFGSGTVQVMPGGQAFLAASGTYTNAFDLSGAGAQEDAGVLGAVRFGTGAVISGGVTLSGDTRLTAFSAGDTGTISGNITGSGGIEKTGAGTLILSGATKSYSGATIVNAGTLLANGSLSSAVTINNSGTFGAGNAAGNRATLGTGSLFANAGGSALFDLGNVTTAGGGNNDLIQVTGNLTLPTSGTFGINVNPVTGVLANGAYTLMSYTGSLLGGNVSNLALTGGAANTRQTLGLDLTTSPGSLLLNVTGNAASLKYNNAGANATWNLNSTANFDNGGANDKFYNGDAVTFEDTVSPAGPYTVTLAGALVPSGLTVNSTKNITFAGSGTLSGNFGLTKSGTGNLDITAGHSFTGANVINGGIVKMLGAGALGTGSITVNNGGALDHNGITMGSSVAITIAGAGPDGLGALRSTAAGNGTINSLTLSGDATIGGGNGRWDIGSSAIALNGGTFTLTKVGSNSTWFRSLSSTTLGNLVVNAGQFGVESGNNALGSTAFTATVNPGGELSSWGGVSQNKPLVLNGGTLDTDWAGGTSTWTGPVSVTANSFLKADAAGATVVLSGDITGTGGLTQTATTAGDAIFHLSGNNSYSGPTMINAGTIRAGSITGLSSASAYTVANGASLRLNGFSNSIGSLAGAGTVTNTSATAATLTAGGDNFSTSFTGSLSDGIGGGALSLTKTGTGTLTLTGISTLTGTTTVAQGTLLLNGELTASPVVITGGILAGTGKISAGATISGTLSPGNSPGIIDFNGSNLTQGSASASLFEIGGTNPAADIDRIVNINSFTLDGLWTISLYNGFNPALNDSFDLWDATLVDNSGFNTATDLNLPSLSGGLAWDSSAFSTTGVLTVVPEPGSAALGSLAALALLRRRRR